MTERILQELDALDKEATELLKRRAKENNLQRKIKEKISITPLTFDLQLEFEEAKIAPKITETKFSGIRKSKRDISFKPDLEFRKNDSEKLSIRSHSRPSNTKIQGRKVKESVEENLKLKSIGSFYYLKDTTEAEYAKPLQDLYSQHRQDNRRKLYSTVFSSGPHTQTNAYYGKGSSFSAAQTKKETSHLFDPVGYLEDYVNKRTKPPPSLEVESIRNVYSSGKKRSLLPLSFEDELKNPNAKIINANVAKTEAHLEQEDKHPIIFFGTGYVQMLLLAKYNYPHYYVKNRSNYTQRRPSLILDENHSTLNSFINIQHTMPSKLKRTIPTVWGKNRQAAPFERSCRFLKGGLKKEINKETLENIHGNKFYDFSQTFSSLTKKVVGFLDRTAIQEKSANTGRFEKISTVKPMRAGKFSDTHIKYCSKPIKHALEVHFSKNVTPLDTLLKISS